MRNYIVPVERLARSLGADRQTHTDPVTIYIRTSGFALNHHRISRFSGYRDLMLQTTGQTGRHHSNLYLKINLKVWQLPGPQIYLVLRLSLYLNLKIKSIWSLAVSVIVNNEIEHITLPPVNKFWNKLRGCTLRKKITYLKYILGY